MANAPMIMGQNSLDWRILRPVAPLLLLPAGILFCLAHAFLPYGQFHGVGPLFKWSVLVHSPWAIAAIMFERSLRLGETRQALLRRAAILALFAYAISSCGSFWLGVEIERAFLSRMPLVAAALLLAGIYPLRPVAAKALDAHQPAEEDLPVDASHVLYAAGAGNYVELHCGSRTTLWRQTLRDAEELLRPAGFVRIHRSYLVARRAISDVHRSRRGPVEIALINGQRLPVSTSYAANVEDPTR